MQRPKQYLRRLLAAAAVLAMSTGGAVACAICLAAVNVSLGQRIDNADRVVLVMKAPDGTSPRIVAWIKSNQPAAESEAVSSTAPGSGPVQVFVRDGLGRAWSDTGTMDLEQTAWLRSFAATATPPEDARAAAPDAAWLERLALVLSQADSSDPFIAELVTGELARAPYAALRVAGAGLDPDELLRQIDGGNDPRRRAVQYLFLGASGSDETARLIEQKLEAALRDSDTTDLAALLAADLELGGAGRVDWIESTYLLDRARTLPELEAALLALQVHGDIDGAIPRARIVKAYRRLIKERPPIAGFVAPDLAEWEEWGATADYVALLATGAVTDPASEFAIRSYVGQSPDVAARSALELIQ